MNFPKTKTSSERKSALRNKTSKKRLRGIRRVWDRLRWAPPKTLLMILSSLVSLLGGLLFSTLGLVGYITPRALSGFFSMMGSSMVMLNIFTLYHLLRSQSDRTLVKDGLNRIVNDKN